MAGDVMLPEKAHRPTLKYDRKDVAHKAEQSIEPNPLDYSKESLARENAAIEKENGQFDRRKGKRPCQLQHEKILNPEVNIRISCLGGLVGKLTIE